MLTCDEGREKKSAEEMVNWLTKIADEKYPRNGSAKPIGSDGEEAAGASIADALELELKQLRESKASKSTGAERFTVADTDGRAMAILRCRDKTLPLVALITHMMEDTLDSGEKNTRYTNRVIPLEKTVYSTMENFKPIAKASIEMFFGNQRVSETQSAQEVQSSSVSEGSKKRREIEGKGDLKTYAVFFKHRGKNKKMDRMECINTAVEFMPKDMKVDLDNPDVTVVVQIIGRITGVSVIRDFKKLSEFNVRMLLERATANAS